MGNKDVIRALIFLPQEFYEKSNVSMYSLLKECGYFKIYDKIEQMDIRKELFEYPEGIDLWLNWSENKRSDSGWYIRKNHQDKYSVGNFEGELKTYDYTDRFEACALFIKNEIEDIRKS